MKADTPSYTAQHMALLRAAHQLLDNPPVLQDPFALALAGPDARSRIRRGGIAIHSRVQRQIRAFAAARSRVLEDELAQAVCSGVRQLVVLGAGFDSFAYRNPYASHRLRVFEVDHPNTQAMKQQRLASAGIAVPENLHWVPVDFEKDALRTELWNAGFLPHQPALFSWLGVSMYLRPETVTEMLHFIATQCAVGSGVVFDYITPLSRLPIGQQIRLRIIKGLVALRGEPWQSFFDPQALGVELAAAGFSRCHDLDASELNQRYFSDRTDGLHLAGIGHVLCAYL